MRAFAAGLVVGLIAGGALGWALGDARSPAPAPSAPADPRPARDDAGTTPARDPAPAPPAPSPGPAPPPRPAEADFPPGVAVLRADDGYDFGATRVSSGASVGQVDVRCMGIKPNAVELLLAGGAHQVPRPFLSGDDSLYAERLFDRVSSAPEGELPASSIVMEKRSRNGTGVFVVRARSGRHFKVALVDIERTPGAEPAARIRYEEVPARPGGGRVDGDAEGAVQRAAPVDLQEQLRSVQQAVRFTGESFASFLSGAYVSVSGLPAEFEPKGRSYLVLEEPLTTKITFDRYSGLVARAGIAREGHVAIKSYTGVLCRGDLSGTVDVNSYAFLQVDGNLTGTVNVDSYATVVVRGDITGTLKISSYVTLLLTGRVTGTLETKGWGSGKCFIDRHAFGSEAETLPGSGSVVLHLRESDLAEGRHEGIGAWKEVVVGGEAWKDAPR